MGGQEMILDVNKFPVFIDPVQNQAVPLEPALPSSVPFECMTAVAMIVDPSIWGSVVAHEH